MFENLVGQGSLPERPERAGLGAGAMEPKGMAVPAALMCVALAIAIFYLDITSHKSFAPEFLYPFCLIPAYFTRRRTFYWIAAAGLACLAGLDALTDFREPEFVVILANDVIATLLIFFVAFLMLQIEALERRLAAQPD